MKVNIKTILRWVFGCLLLLLSLIMLLSFIFSLTETDIYGKRIGLDRLTVMDVVFFLLVILGFGVPGGLLIRDAVRKDGKKPGNGKLKLFFMNLFAKKAADPAIDAAEPAEEAVPAPAEEIPEPDIMTEEDSAISD